MTSLPVRYINMNSIVNTKYSSNNCLLFYIASVLCVLIGQFHAHKCDFDDICGQYLLADNSMSYLLADNYN